MSVFQNIAFPLQAQGVPKAEIKEGVDRIVCMLGLQEHVKRRPRHLSGGQRQRVAMGRALVRRPKVFLMDEPLSNLDAKLRVEMRGEVTRLQRELNVTTIYVTHDQVEAMTMGDRIAVMRNGVLQQVGPPQTLYDSPQNLFVAEFIGSPPMNLMQGTLEVRDDSYVLVMSEAEIELPRSYVSTKPGLIARTGHNLAFGIRPEHLLTATEADPHHPRLRAEVLAVESLGAERLVHMRLPSIAVITDAVLDAAEERSDLSTPRAQEAAARPCSAARGVARFAPDTTVCVGDQIEVALVTEKLRPFDLKTGEAL
jgi:multiple sugar transport system ATP-binding protein